MDPLGAGQEGGWGGGGCQVLGRMWGLRWGRASLLISLSPCHKPPCRWVGPEASVLPPQCLLFCLFYGAPCPRLPWASLGLTPPVCLAVSSFTTAAKGLLHLTVRAQLPGSVRRISRGDCQELFEREGRRGASPRSSELTG